MFIWRRALHRSMAIDDLIIGARERAALNSLPSLSRNAQGYVLCNNVPHGAGRANRAFGIVITGYGEPYDSANDDPGIKGHLDNLLFSRPEIKAIPFHIHTNSMCTAAPNLATSYCNADLPQLINYANADPDFMSVLATPAGIRSFEINLATSAPVPLLNLHKASASGQNSNADIELVHGMYESLLRGWGVQMYRLPAPAAPTAPAAPASAASSKALPWCWYADKYSMAGTLLIGGLGAPWISDKMDFMEPGSTVFEGAGYCMLGAAALIGAYTVITHLCKGSK